MKIAIILPACVLLCTAEPPLYPYKAFPKDAKYPISFQERAEPAGPTENGKGWGWKNKELKHADEGWDSDKLTETTSLPPVLLLIPTEPEDSSEPAIIITNASKGPKTRQAQEDEDSTLHIFGGDAEKAQAVDWGSEGYKQLKTASAFESWKTSTTDAAFLQEDVTTSPEIEADSEGQFKGSKAGPSKGWGKGSAKAQKGSVSYEAKGQKAYHAKAQKAHHTKGEKGDDYELKTHHAKGKSGDDYELKAQKAHQIKAQKAQDYEFKAHHKAANKAAAQKAAAHQAKAFKAAAQTKGKKAEGVAKASEDYRVEAVYFKDY